MGEYYRFGYGNQVGINSELGYECHRKGAECGDALAILNTSYMYDIDSEEFKHIQNQIILKVRELAENGDVIAQNELSSMCKDEERIYWLSKAISNGNWRSMYNLGLTYYGEDKTEEEYFKAIYYFSQASEKGCNDATLFIGLMYDWGYGFKQNGTEANKWFKKAAEEGNIVAASFYGQNLYSGYNVEENQNEAKKWLEFAAKGGNEDAKEFLKENF